MLKKYNSAITGVFHLRSLFLECAASCAIPGTLVGRRVASCQLPAVLCLFAAMASVLQVCRMRASKPVPVMHTYLGDATTPRTADGRLRLPRREADGIQGA